MTKESYKIIGYCQLILMNLGGGARPPQVTLGATPMGATNIIFS